MVRVGEGVIMRFFAILLICTLWECGEQKSEGNSDYFPFAVGHRWVYEETGFIEGIVTKEVTGTEEYGGRSTFVWTTTQTNSTVTKRSNWVVEDGRIVRVRQQRLDSAGNILTAREYEPGFLRFSDALAQAGDQLQEQHVRKEYDAQGTLIGQTTKTYTWLVEAEEEEVTVPAGTFTCLRIRRVDADTGTKTYWFADGVGKVMEQDLIEAERLQSYSVEE
jgi:hypothetical protein